MEQNKPRRTLAVDLKAFLELFLGALMVAAVAGMILFSALYPSNASTDEKPARAECAHMCFNPDVQLDTSRIRSN